MWPDDRFRELVGIELPIIQACGFSKSIRYGIIEFFVPAFD